MCHCQRNEDWNYCLPVNIYVYRNGTTGEPTLVHISGDMKRTMDLVLEAIQDRLKFEGGYPEALYYRNGFQVCRTTELEMYEKYVVTTSIDSRFRCEEYGRPRSPLIVTRGPCKSKHVRHLCVNDWSFNMHNINRRKKEDKMARYGLMHRFDQDGYGPADLPYTDHCSARQCCKLCRFVKRNPCFECPCPPPALPQYHLHHHCPPPPCTCVTECTDYMDPDEDGFYSAYERECLGEDGYDDEFAGESRGFDAECAGESGGFDEECAGESGGFGQERAGESGGFDQERAGEECSEDDAAFYSAYEKECAGEDGGLPGSKEANDEKERGVSTTDLQKVVDEYPGASADTDHLLTFINRYRNIGGQLYQMFNDRLNQGHGNQECGVQDMCVSPTNNQCVDDEFGALSYPNRDGRSRRRSSVRRSRDGGSSRRQSQQRRQSQGFASNDRRYSGAY